MQSYVGRFAPSPSGPLHFGSLVCALVSFLHARQAHGKWLVRIEDVDTTRIQDGAADIILSQLQAHGMQWDDQIVYQTQRQRAYQSALEELIQQKAVYACECTRQAIKAKGKFYTGTCRELALPFLGNSIRVINNGEQASFEDLHLGKVQVDIDFCTEDLSIRRKDGLFAYNFAVVIDDIFQQVTHVVRGADLIDTTMQQNYLYKLFKMPCVSYFHLPVICNETFKKLSKQNHAEAVDNQFAAQNLLKAFELIGLLSPELSEEMSVSSLVDWAVKHWSPKLLAKQREILLSGTNAV